MRYQIEHIAGSHGARRYFEPLNESSAFSGTFDPRVSVTLQVSEGNHFAERTRRASMETSSDNSGRKTPPVSNSGIHFFPDGTCDEAVLQLRDLSGHRMTIRLNPVTARLSLRDQP